MANTATQINETTKQWMAWLEQCGAAQYGTLTLVQHNEIKKMFSALPHFKSEDVTEGKVLYIGADRNPKDANEMRVVVYVWNEAAQAGGFWRGSLADVYGQGNDSNKTRRQKTMEALERVGVKSLNELTTLIGKIIPIWVKGREYNGQEYYDIATIGSTNANVPEAIPLSELFGGAPTTPAAPTVPAMPPVASAPAMPQAPVPMAGAIPPVDGAFA